MAEHQTQQRPQHQPQNPTEGIKNLLPDKGPSASQVVAVATLFPIGGVLLTLSAITLAGTIIGLVLLTPLLFICSPVLVPAAAVVGLAVMGFLASGAFGLTGVSSLSWILNYVQVMRSEAPEKLEHARRRMQEAAGHAGQRTRDIPQGRT